MRTYDPGKYAAGQQKMRMTYVTTRMPLDNILARWPGGGHGGPLVVTEAADPRLRHPRLRLAA
jgi:hypothetical protein